MNNIPLVSVICTTYNHEAHIKYALEGILMQKTNFPIEIIVHDDASTDRTAEIIKEYEKKYPNLFFNVYQTVNQYSKNDLNIWGDITFPMSRGKYIAICEGDDYWTDPNKLQDQVDFMETHSDYVLIHSDVYCVNNLNERINNIRSIILALLKKRRSGVVTNYLVKGNYIMTLTVLILKDALLEAGSRIVKNNKQVAYIDYTLFLELSSLGKIYYMSKRTAAYRILFNSASHSSDLNSRLNFVHSTINISRFYNQKFAIGLSERYFDRVYLSAQLKELANRKLFLKFFGSFYNGIKLDQINIFRIKNYYYFMILLLKIIRRKCTI